MINDRVNRTASHVHREKKYNSLLNTHGKMAKKAQQNGPPKYWGNNSAEWEFRRSGNNALGAKANLATHA